MSSLNATYTAWSWGQDPPTAASPQQATKAGHDWLINERRAPQGCEPKQALVKLSCHADAEKQ